MLDDYSAYYKQREAETEAKKRPQCAGCGPSPHQDMFQRVREGRALLDEKETLEFKVSKLKWELAEAKRTIRGLSRALGTLNDIVAGRVGAP